MSQFKVKEAIEIPYFDHDKSLFGTLKNSSKRRKTNPIFYFFRKIFNYLLFYTSFYFPLNSIRIFCNKLRGVRIGKNVYIGMHCTIDNAYPEYIYIEDNVSLAGECMIIAHSNPFYHFHNITSSYVKPTVIKKGAWIGIRSVILPGVVVNQYSIVSAGSIVNEDVPERSVVVGNPAKVISKNLQID